MRKKRIVIALFCLVGVSAVAITYGRGRTLNKAPEQPQQIGNTSEGPQQSGQAKQPQPGSFRQQEVYEHMFRHYMFLKNKAQELEQEGKDAKSLRQLYKNEAKLTDVEADQLERAANECMSRLSVLEARAKQVIAEARARVPGGRLQEGEEPPPPPEELSALQRERESTVLQAREGLRRAFGDQAFARFDEFVQQKVAGNMKNVPLDRRHKPKLRGKKRQ